MFASLHTSSLAVRHVAGRGTLRAQAASLITSLQAALRVRAERKALLQLDGFRLADIGLSAEEAAREAARPLWDAPKAWRNA